MRVGIDARFLTHPQYGGFKRYSENLVRALAAMDGKTEYVLYTDRPATLAFPANFQVRVLPGSLPKVGSPWREQALLPREAVRDRIDVLHSLCATAPLWTPCPLVVTVHDALPFRGGHGWSRPILRWYNRIATTAAVHRAAAVITVSENARDCIAAEYDRPRDEIHVTLEAAAPCFHRITDRAVLTRTRARYGLGDFILTAGSLDPRKNLFTVIDTYAALPQPLRERYQLAIAIPQPEQARALAEHAARSGHADAVRCLVGLPDDDLCALYNVAALFVLLSDSEGFGLPILEAMTCGAPVIASNRSAIPEVAGEAALLVDPSDRTAVTAAMTAVLGDTALQDHLRATGRARAARYSWERCARDTRTVYAHVARRAAAPARVAGGSQR